MANVGLAVPSLLAKSDVEGWAPDPGAGEGSYSLATDEDTKLTGNYRPELPA